MPDHLASLREAQFRDFVPKPLTDQEPVFMLVPATSTNLYHFCAKHRVKQRGGYDSLFMLGACVGQPVKGGPAIVCGIIQVGRPVERRIGDCYVAEVWTCAHDIVPGIRRFLFERAVRASRALGFHRLLAGPEPDHGLLLETGFREDGGHWALQLADDFQPPALPESSIDV